MSVSPVSTVSRFPCGSCGADLHYDAATAGLLCTHCGARSPIEVRPEPSAQRVRDSLEPIATGVGSPSQGGDASTQHQEPTERALRTTSIDSVALEGWGTDRSTLECKSCGAVTEVDPRLEATECPFCGSAHVLKASHSEADVVRPETLIPFRVTREAALGRFRQWVASLWFRPGALKKSWQLGRISGIYLPFWTFDAAAFSRWTAEAGYYYWVKSGGRSEQRTRWETVSGELSGAYDDELVCASRGLHSALIDGVAPYDTRGALVPYSPAYLAGWTAERYAIGLKEAWQEGQRRMRDKAQDACARQVPGDTHRNLAVRTELSNVTWKHVLLPVWTASYLYGGKRFHFLVNGESGAVHGNAPYSWVKIALAIAGVFVAGGVLHWLGIFD